jgi:hypothetical protein
VDKPFVRDLVTRLRGDGVDSWLDEIEIHVGDSIHEKINDGLKQSDFFVVILSRASVVSKWVRNELTSASALEKYSQRGILILPVLLEECDIPPLLLDRRYANFKDDAESAYQELLDAVRHHFSRGHPDTDIAGINIQELTEEIIAQAVADPQILRALPPRHFEELIARLLSRAGYEVILTPATHDGGYDLIAQHQLPLFGSQRELILVQCKRYSRPVGAAEIYSLIGAKMTTGANRAVFVTTSRFTRSAVHAAGKGGISLADGEQIRLWIEQYWPKTPAPETPPHA